MICNKINPFKTKNERSLLVKKNIFAAFCLKGFSVLVSFILVPMTLGYLNPYEYGIWLTLNSVLSWVYIFDIGLGNGLRNKLTEALAKQDFNLGKIYVSTSFFGMSILATIIFILFHSFSGLVDWYKIFNVEPNRVENLGYIISIVVGIMCITFIFKLVGNVYMAKQLPAVNDFMGFCASLLSLCIIYILTKTTTGSLKDVAITFTGSSACVYILSFLFAFAKFKNISPSLKYIKFEYFKDLMTLGINFMIIQIAVLVIFLSSNLIISNLFGPSEVTPYNIAFKYFSIISMAFTMILTPIWSAVTDAKSRDDFNWIKNARTKLLRIWFIMMIIVIIMILFSNIFYNIWIGNKVEIPLKLSIWMALYVGISSFSSLFANIINGLGKIRLQLSYAIIQAMIYIPLSIYLGRLLGVIGVLIALCCVCLIGGIINYLQVNKILNNKAAGIWNK